MKIKFVVIGLIFTLLVSFSIIAGLSSNHEDGKAFAKSSSIKAVAITSQDQEKKKAGRWVITVV